MPTSPAEQNDDVTEAQRKSFAERLSRATDQDETAAADFNDPNATTNSEGREDDGSYLPFLSPPRGPNEIGRLNGYRLLRQLGEGGMGLVFEAEDIKLKRRVALKVMKPEVAVKEQHRVRFIREAQTAAAVEHDHICPIYEVGEENGVPFIAMPFLKGEPLDVYLKRMKPLDVADSIRIGREVALGLYAAHEAGLVHRDIKPANVWLETRPNGQSRARILDFGLARGLADDVQVTASGAILGTPAYMAPEQARGKPVDRRADLFSLGVMLYEMTTGRRPFIGGDTLAILTSLAVDDPTMPHLINPAIPVEFSRLIMSLLSKTPEKRPASGRAVSDALLGILTHTSRPIVEAIPGDAVSPRVSKPDATAVIDWQELDEPEQVEAPPIPVSCDAKVLHSGARETERSWLRGTKVVIAAALLLLIGGGFAAYKLVFQSKDGTLLVEVDGDADLRFKNGELQIFGADGKLKYTLKPGERSKNLPPGKYAVQVVSADGVKLDTDKFEMSKDGKVILRVTADAIAVAKKEPKIDPEAVRRAEAQAAFPALEAKFKAADVTFASFAKEVGDFKAKHGGSPAAIKAAELLMKLTSPLDQLDATKIPEDAKAAWKASGFDGKAVVGVLGEHRGRQNGIIRRVVHHPNGKVIASSGDDGSIHLWDSQTLRELAQFKGVCPVFTADGKMFGIVGPKVCRWDFAQNDPGQAIVVMEAPAGVTHLAVTRDGKRMAVSHGDPVRIDLWDLTAKPPKRSAEAKLTAPNVNSLTFDSEGKFFITGSHDKIVRLWDVRGDEPKELAVLAGHGDWVYQAAISPDGKWIGSAGAWDFTARLWAVEKESAKPAGVLPIAAAVCSVAFSPDSKLFAFGLWTGEVVLFELKPAGPEQKAVLKGLKTQVWGISFSPDGKTLAAGGTEGGIRLWDVETGKEVQPLTGHIGPLNSVSLSPDDALLLSAGADGLARAWDPLSALEQGSFAASHACYLPRIEAGGDRQAVAIAPNGALLLIGQGGKVLDPFGLTARCLAFAPDGRHIVLGSNDGALALVDLKKKAEVRRFAAHATIVYAVAVSPDGKTLASGSGKHGEPIGEVKLWDAATSRPPLILKHPANVYCMAFSPDGTTLAVGGQEPTVRLWNLRRGIEQASVSSPLHVHGVVAMAYSPDGRTLATLGNWENKLVLLLWDPINGKKLREFSVIGPAKSIAFAADGRHIATANGNGTVYILRIAESSWSAEKNLNALQARLADPKADRESLRKDLLAYRVKYAAFPDHTLTAAELLMKLPSPLDALDPAKIPDDAKAAWKASGFDGNDVVAVLGEHRQRHWAGVTRVAYHPDGRTFASASADGVVTLWAADSTAELRSIRAHNQYITAMAFRPGGQMLATSAHDGWTRLWDANTGKLIHAFGGHAGVTALAFSADGKVLASGGTGDHAIHLWEVDTHKLLRTLTGHQGWVMGLAFSGKDLVLASGSRDGSVRLWDGNSGKGLRTLIRQEEPGLHDWQVAFSPDGQKLAAVHPISGLKVWVAATGAELANLSGRSTVAIRPGERPMLLSNSGTDLQLWDLSTGKEQLTIKGAACASATFSPDARRLVSGHADGAVRLWDVETGKEVRPLTGPVGPATDLAFTPDAGELFVGYQSNSAVLWDLRSQKQRHRFPGGPSPYATRVAISPNAQWLAATMYAPTGTLNLWSRETGALVRSPPSGNPALVPCFSQDGRYFAAACGSSGTQVWTAETGEILFATPANQNPLQCALNADSAVLAVVENRGVTFYELPAGKKRRTIKPQSATSIHFHPDGQRIALGAEIWNHVQGKSLLSVAGGGTITSFSPDGKYCTSVAGNTFGIYEVKTGNKLREWQLPGPIHAVAFAADGRHIAAANANGTVYILRLPWSADATPLALTSEQAKQQQADAAKTLGVPATIENSIGMKLNLIPAGKFLMGSPETEAGRDGDEGPPREVTIGKPYYLGAHEVTVGHFKAFVDATGHVTEAEKSKEGSARLDYEMKKWVINDPAITWRTPGWEQTGDHPVTCVSWNDAVAFCAWLGKKEGKKYRLPTEAEWEYACRAGTTSPFSHGDIGQAVNYNGDPDSYWGSKDALRRLTRAGAYPANAFGLHDMHGNVWEWCSDWYGPYPKEAVDDPQGPATGEKRVNRGGAFHAPAKFCRSAYREKSLAPGDRGQNIGFRVVCEIRSPVGLDPDRKAAEYVLSIGGAIKIAESGNEREIKAVGDLPRGAFALTFVNSEKNPKVNDAGLAIFKDCQNLKFLALHNTQVSDAGLAHFKDCKNLTFLGLHDTRVSDVGLAHFKDCKNLTQLHLGGTKVSDVGLAYFKDCRHLTFLALGVTQVSDAGLAHFKDFKNLTHLHLPYTLVTDAGLAYFKDCKNLTVLLLGGPRSQVSDAGLAHFKDCKNLTSLGLGTCKATAEGLKKLAAALPQCKIEWDGGVIEPTRTFHPGKSALQFDTSSNSVSLPGLQVDLAKSGSFEIWLEWQSAKGSAIPLLLTGKDQLIYLQIFEKDVMQLVVVPKNLGAGANSDCLLWKTKLPAGWVHVAASWSQGNYVLFVNGKPVDGRIDYKYRLPAGLSSNIGKNPNDPIGPATPPSEAMLNINQLRVSSNARFTKPFVPDKRFAADAGTIALYPFDEGQGDKLTDSSGNNRHGKIVGAKWVKVD